MTQTIYSIGYGGRKIEAFLDLLKRHEIACLVDIRTSPTSRFRPDYRKAALELHLSQAGIRYLYMGDALGGRPSDPACYSGDQVDYGKVQQQPLYVDGISRLRQLLEAEERPARHVCVMCAEAKPEECHRTRLIGQTLADQGIEVLHIDETGQIQSHDEVVKRLDQKAGPTE